MNPPEFSASGGFSVCRILKSVRGRIASNDRFDRRVTAAPQSLAARTTVAAIERQARGAFFIIQINRRDGDVFTAPPATTVVGEGDGVVLIGRPNRADILTSLFELRSRGARG